MTKNQTNTQKAVARRVNSRLRRVMPKVAKVNGVRFDPVELASRCIKRNIASGNLDANMDEGTRTLLTLERIANYREGKLPRRSQMKRA